MTTISILLNPSAEGWDRGRWVGSPMGKKHGCVLAQL